MGRRVGGSYGQPMGILKEDDFFLEPMGVFFLFPFLGGVWSFFLGGKIGRWEDVGHFWLRLEHVGQKNRSGSKVSSDVRCWDGIFFHGETIVAV